MKSSIETAIQKALSEGMKYNEIMKELHVSPRTIAKVSKSMSEPFESRVFDLFRAGDKTPFQVMKETGMGSQKIGRLYSRYVKFLELMKNENDYVKSLEGSRIYELLRSVEQEGLDTEKPQGKTSASMTVEEILNAFLYAKLECEDCGFPILNPKGEGFDTCPACGGKSCVQRTRKRR